MDPRAIKDPEVRRAYEDAIAENERRAEKSKRELSLSRGGDYAVIDVWRFARGFPADSVARKRSFQIIETTVDDPSLLNRLKSDTLPALTQ